MIPLADTDHAEFHSIIQACNKQLFVLSICNKELEMHGYNISSTDYIHKSSLRLHSQ